MIVARIDRDYINNLDDKTESEYNRVGKTFELTNYGLEKFFTYPQFKNFEAIKVRFRLLDDDGEVYYGGWLYNDGACEVQQVVLAWAVADAGACIIEIRETDTEEWKQEIG